MSGLSFRPIGIHDTPFCGRISHEAYSPVCTFSEMLLFAESTEIIISLYVATS